MRRHLLSSLFLGLWLALISFGSSAFADTMICRLDGTGDAAADMSDCPKRADSKGDTTAIGSPWLGLRTNRGWSALTPIDAHGICRYVDNLSSQDYFVPFRSSEEWHSFISSYPRGVLDLVHCARPFSGVDMDAGLYIGTSSAQPGSGDTGDPSYVAVSLPYARTGTTWVESHTFSNACYEEYAVAKCWNWVNKTCTDCDSTDIDGNCIASHSYDCSYCGDSGSTCEKRNYSWSEVFSFVAIALDSDTKTPSWSGSSSRLSGSRPAQCSTRCAFNGHDCLGCNNPYGSDGDDPDPEDPEDDEEKVMSCGSFTAFGTPGVTCTIDGENLSILTDCYSSTCVVAPENQDIYDKVLSAYAKELAKVNAYDPLIFGSPSPDQIATNAQDVRDMRNNGDVKIELPGTAGSITNPTVSSP